MFDVAIIGAGVIGAMTARALARYRVGVCILEKEHDVAMGATRANSAIVHAGFDAPTGSKKALFNVRGAEMMSDICKELGVKYRQNGSLVLGYDESDRETLIMLYERGTANGVRELELLEQKELRALEPNVSDAARFALHAPTGGIVCPYELTLAAIGSAMDHGATLKRNFAVRAIEQTGAGFRLSSPHETVEARFVVNCAGLFSDEIAAMIGDHSFRIHPRRGEYVLLDRDCGSHVSHTLFRTPTKMGKGILVTPTVDSNLLLGPTSVDAEDKEDRSTTAQGLREVLTRASEMVKGLPSGCAITSFCGLRAAGDTGDFVINAPKAGFINAAGIESPGLSASPAIAEEILRLLRDAGLSLLENENFHPVRTSMHAFREASLDEKNRMIRENPAYGKIVCRCEGISEGEILDAIRTEPRATDLDGIKRRCRAQMGRCQGGFCSPHIIELLANELGIPFEEVTKRGGASFLNTARTKEGWEQ